MRLLVLTVVILYVISQQVSMAGMEIFGWASGIFGLVSWVSSYGRKSFEVYRERVYLPWIDLSLLAFFVVILISIVLSPPAEADRLYALGSARWIILFVLLRLALAEIDFRKSERFVLFVIGLTGVIGVYAIFQYFTGIDLVRGTGRLSPVSLAVTPEAGVAHFRSAGFFALSTTFAHSMAIWACLPFAYLFFVPSQSSLKKLLVFAAGVLGFAAIMLSLTRGAYISFPIALLLVAFFAGRAWFARVLVGLVCAGAIAFALSPEIRQRSATITQTQGYNSNDQRIGLWKANFAMFKDHPLFGIGFNMNEEKVEPYLKKLGLTYVFRGNAHNTYMQNLAGTGILGFSAFMIFIISALVFARRFVLRADKKDYLLKALVVASIGGQVVTHIGGLTDCNFKDAEVNHAVLFAIALGLTLYVSQRKQAEARL